MFYPPTSFGLGEEPPQPRPVYDIPPVIVRHRPVRTLVARLANRPRRAHESCPEPRPESSF